MAHLYPSTYPKENALGDPEFEVFEILKELPDNFHIFYSKKLVGTKGAKAETEIDFLIFDGKKTMICLEVKGGLIDYDGYTSGWSQNKKKMEKDPDRQASAACHTLINYLNNDAKNLNIGWALAFPHCSKPPHMGNASDVPDTLILDERALLKPLDAIEKVISFLAEQHKRPGLNSNQATRVIEQLIREIHFVQKVGYRLARDEKALIKATDEQMDVLADLEVNPRCIIRGGAGTGKTLMAQEYAKRRSTAGDRVLLLFYNRSICNTVRHGLGRESEIVCATYHSLARELITAEDPTWWKAQNSKDEDFWESSVPLRLLDTDVRDSEKFDTIIIDEGQDFKADWFTNLMELLKDRQSGRFTVFYDENQDIFGRWEDVPWGKDGVPRKLLTKNCRNSKQIHDYLDQLIPGSTQSAEMCPQGDEVILHQPTDRAGEAKLVSSILSDLIGGATPPGDIVILVNSSLSESSISDLKRVGKTNLEWMSRSYRRNSRSIQITSIASFKGLEAPIVLILGFNSNSDRNQAYTQASRANLLLHLFETNSI